MDLLKNYNIVVLLQVALFILCDLSYDLSYDLYSIIFSSVVILCFSLINFHLYLVTPFHKIGTKVSTMVISILYTMNIVTTYFGDFGLNVFGLSFSVVSTVLSIGIIVHSSDMDIKDGDSDDMDDKNVMYLVFRRPSSMLETLIAFSGLGSASSMSVYSNGTLYSFRKRYGLICETIISEEKLLSQDVIVRKTSIPCEDHKKYYDKIKHKKWNWRNFNCSNSYEELLETKGITISRYNPAKFLNDWDKKYRRS